MRPFVRLATCPLFAAAVLSAASVTAAEISRVDGSPAATPLAMRIVGRTVATKNARHETVQRMQWPGVYFETAFEGRSILVQTGAGRAIFHVVVDDQPAVNIINSVAASYAVDAGAPGHHTVRVELATECQGGPVDFVGLALPKPGEAKPEAVPPARQRQIEFIGDSHTVGYGNTSTKRQCTPDEIWATTDTSRAFGPLVGKHYDADYEINAISGRGIVRNYNGGGGDPLPAAYPFALFDHTHRVQNAAWSPDVIVVGLGTNDFSTKLNPGEKWKNRDELHSDFEKTYVQFATRLRARDPRALIVLAANDSADGEIESEVRKVIGQLNASGDSRVDYVEFNHLELTACDWHPSLKDDLMMAAAIEKVIDAHPDAWPNRGEQR